MAISYCGSECVSFTCAHRRGNIWNHLFSGHGLLVGGHSHRKYFSGWVSECVSCVRLIGL